MIKHEDGSISDLPQVTLPGQLPKDCKSTLLRATHMSAEEVALLVRCLANYADRDDEAPDA